MFRLKTSTPHPSFRAMPGSWFALGYRASPKRAARSPEPEESDQPGRLISRIFPAAGDTADTAGETAETAGVTADTAGETADAAGETADAAGETAERRTSPELTRRQSAAAVSETAAPARIVGPTVLPPLGPPSMPAPHPLPARAAPRAAGQPAGEAAGETSPPEPPSAAGESARPPLPVALPPRPSRDPLAPMLASLKRGRRESTLPVEFTTRDAFAGEAAALPVGSGGSLLAMPDDLAIGPDDTVRLDGLGLVFNVRRDGWIWFALLVRELSSPALSRDPTHVDGHISLIYIGNPSPLASLPPGALGEMERRGRATLRTWEARRESAWRITGLIRNAGCSSPDYGILDVRPGTPFANFLHQISHDIVGPRMHGHFRKAFHLSVRAPRA